MSKKAYLIRIKGRVTGVGFRWATLDKSYEFSSLTGYVRNVRSGEVEVFVQGSDAKEIDEFISWLRQGPPYARVDSIEVLPVAPNDEFTSFEIR